MDFDKVNSLKQKGNRALLERKYDEAFDFYAQALELVGLEDKKVAAVLYSNISQAYLDKKDYPRAIENANDSLKLDPSFTKSNFRRAIANTELDNITDAMTDLRLIFSFEPMNKAAKQLMRRCSDFPKMKQELHEVYAKHYLRPMLKKLGAHDTGHEFGPRPVWFRNALLRQSFLSMRGLDISNEFFCKADVSLVFSTRQTLLNLCGWIMRQFTLLKYAVSPNFINLSEKLFKLFYSLFRPGTFALVIISRHPLCDETLLLNKYSDVYLAKEGVLGDATVNERDLETMNYYSDDMTCLVYHPGFANSKKNKFPKAKALAFDEEHSVTSEFLKLWKKNQWPIESLSFVHGVPDLQIFENFNGVVSSKVKNVSIRFGEKNEVFNKVSYSQVCNNLSTLKSAFSGLCDVTITHMYEMKSLNFPMVVQDMALIREASETFSTKPEWCSKLKVLVSIEVKAQTVPEFKMFDVKLLEQAVKSLRQKHPDLRIRLCGPRSYENLWFKNFYVHAVVEFENDVAHFELAYWTTMFL